MTKWQEVRLGDVCEKVYSGGTPKSSNSMYYNGNIPWLNTKEVHFNRIYKTEKYITNAGLENSSAKWVPSNSVIVAMYGATAGNVAISFIPLTTNQACCNLIIDENKSTFKFIYYYLLFKNTELASLANGGAQQNLNKQQIKDFPINIPPLDVQKKIAGVLGELDDKIELNNKINNNLEQQMYALVEQDILNIETKIFLDEFCNVFTGRKNANEFEKNGVNKFFTCGPDALTINSFIYDGSAIIVSGNGAYTGRTRFYKGKFDLYQRTYACTIKENIKSDYIYILYPILKLQLEKKLMGGTHGSAIPYIVMNDIAKFKVPFNEPVFNKIAPICKAIIDKIQANEAENEKLSAFRNTLLPKLMSGEIDVSKVDISELSSADKLSFNKD